MAVKYLSAEGTQALIDEIKTRLAARPEFGTTLAHYTIADAYTKVQVDNIIAALPDTDDFQILQNSVGDMSGQVSANKAAIELLNGDKTTTGSVANSIAVAIADSASSSFQVVDAVPTAAAAYDGIIYLYKDPDAVGLDLYQQWIKTKDASGADVMINIGDTSANFTDYSTTVQMNAAIAAACALCASDAEFQTVKGNVTTLQSDMAQAKLDIAQNTADITQNTADIAQNTTDIATNAQDISDLDTTVTALTTKVNSVKTQSDTDHTAIAKLNADETVEGSVDYKIAAATGSMGAFQVVAALPDVADASTKIIYLVPDGTATGNDKYKEYIKAVKDASADPVEYEWALIGDTSVDLSGYLQASDVDAALDDASSNPVANSAVTPEINSRLKVVGTMPATAALAGTTVVLYVGADTSLYTRGMIYQWNDTDSAWNGISMADVDLSGYRKVYTGAQEDWDALSDTEKAEWDLAATTGNTADGTMVVSGEVAAGDLNPVTSDAVAALLNAHSLNHVTTVLGYHASTDSSTEITLSLPNVGGGTLCLILTGAYGGTTSHSAWVAAGVRTTGLGAFHNIGGNTTATPVLSGTQITIPLSNTGSTNMAVAMLFHITGYYGEV